MRNVILTLLLTCSSTASAAELSGYVAGEGTLFIEEPLHDEQKKNAASIAGQVEYYHEFEGGSSFTTTIFGRADTADSERTHADLREFNFLYLGSGWEAKIGVSKVYWGVTEFSHLVDIVNQTDGVESIDGEEKMGQPMLHLSIPASVGTFDFFVLPGFRERTFVGKKGRLRFPLVVDTSLAAYESPDEERHVDYAFRYSHSIGNWEIGLSHFTGTGREPLLIYTETGSAPVLRPYYQLIDQTGIELQLMAGDWIWKLESIYRHSAQDDYTAVDGGFEYNFYNILDSGADVGAIVEYLYDSRGDKAPTPYNHDLTLGLRLTFNDVDSTDLLFGFVQDVTTTARAIIVEGSTRFGNSVKATLEGGAFLDAPNSDPFYGFRNDSYIKLELAKYF